MESLTEVKAVEGVASFVDVKVTLKGGSANLKGDLGFAAQGNSLKVFNVKMKILSSISKSQLTSSWLIPRIEVRPKNPDSPPL